MEAFSQTAAAVTDCNEKRLYQLLSKESKALITKNAALTNRMNEKQRSALAQHNALPDGKLDSRTVLKNWLTLNADSDPILISFRRSVLMIEEKDGIAKVRMDNGIELKFVKEGLYWKFSI
jgi:hypothetical protein